MDKNYLIQKWLTNDLTTQEQIAFEQLEDSSFLKEIIEEGQRFKNQNPTKVVDFQTLERKLHKKSEPGNTWVKALVGIAAMLVVAMSLYHIVTSSGATTFETQIAQKEKITLPDTSVITLNELSTVAFNENKWEQEREIKLEGEAFFKVAKGKRFDVRTGLGTVTVLGTQFNVKSRDSVFSVICYEGLVQVSFNGASYKLPAGKALTSKNNRLTQYDVSIIQPEWLQNMKVFEKTTITNVFKSLESHYNIEIIAPDIDKSIEFTGAYELDNLENALKEVTRTLKLSYTLKNAEVVITKDAEE